MGPDGMVISIIDWDATTGGRWRYVASRDGEDYGFHGSFHEVGDERVVQTFTFEGYPDGVSLETLRLEDLGDGRCRLHVQSLVDSFEARDQMLASGMETGIVQGYAKLDRLWASCERSRRAPPHRRRVHHDGGGRRARRMGLAAPPEGWVARYVVRHLLTWFPEFLRGTTGLTLPAGPAVDDDPVGVWRTHTAGVQALLDDPATVCLEFEFPHIGTMTLGAAVSMIYIADVFLHRWDLALAPLGRTELLHRCGARPCTRACSRWTRCCAAAAMTGRPSPSPMVPMPRPSCSGSFGRNP